MVKKIFLIAGEASGDLLGSKLIKETKLRFSKTGEDCEFIGVGGSLMQKEGLVSIFPMEELSLMGFFEVVLHIPKLLRRIKQTAEIIVKEQPDFVITIDSPDFCFRVMKLLQKAELKTKKIHLIAPSVWAYRKSRAKKISKLYDLLLAILPFEPPYFEKYGLKTIFIGHPIIENAPDFERKDLMNVQFREKHAIGVDDLLICVTPGSRNGEVKRIFPQFIKAINLVKEERPNLKVIIPLIDKTRDLVTKMAKGLKTDYFLVEKDEKELAFFASNFALAKSGTNTIEFSLYKIPMIIAYKINFLSFLLLKMMIKIKFANLVNLILNREVIPEMIQSKCDANKIAEELERLISDKKVAKKQILETLPALKLMGLENDRAPIEKALDEVLKL